jgi:hypothetical protein
MSDLFDLLQAKELQIMELKNERLKTDFSIEEQVQTSMFKSSEAVQLDTLNSQLSHRLADKDRRISDLQLAIRSAEDREASKESKMKEKFRAKTAELNALTADLRGLQADTKSRLEVQVRRISSLMSVGEDKLRELVRYIEDLKAKHTELKAVQSISREAEDEYTRLRLENEQLRHMTAHV